MYNMNPPEVNSLSEINSVFSFPRYIKTLIVLRMIQNAITNEVFQKNINTFYETDKYGRFQLITPYQFWSMQGSSANKKYSENAIQINEAWISYKHYPIVSWIEQNITHGILMQNDTWNTNYKWWVDIRLTSQRNPSQFTRSC